VTIDPSAKAGSIPAETLTSAVVAINNESREGMGAWLCRAACARTGALLVSDLFTNDPDRQLSSGANRNKIKDFLSANTQDKRKVNALIKKKLNFTLSQRVYDLLTSS
jgi:hypothetical protein